MTGRFGIMESALCLHETVQLFLLVEQAHNALKSSDMIGGADSK